MERVRRRCSSQCAAPLPRRRAEGPSVVHTPLQYVLRQIDRRARGLVPEAPCVVLLFVMVSCIVNLSTNVFGGSWSARRVINPGCSPGI